MKLNEIQREELKRKLREPEEKKVEKALTLDEQIANYKAMVAYNGKGSVDEYLFKHRYKPDGVCRRPVSLSNGKFLVNL